jgi:hypothetical protein
MALSRNIGLTKRQNMKLVRRKYDIFEQMDLAILEERDTHKGPIETFILTEKEWQEFKINAHNRGGSFRKHGETEYGESIGVWTFKGVKVEKENKK